MQLYYFTGADYALSNIALRRVKVSSLDRLNDPFEWLGPACEQRSDRAALRDLKKKMAEKNGLICFSEDWTNPVHWSHYADQHRGIALGFEVDPTIVEKVHYENVRTVIENLGTVLGSFKDGNASHDWIVKEVICRKFKHWEYEQEWRAFVTLDPTTLDNGNYFLDFNGQLRLNKVLVGANCTITKATLQRAIGELAGIELKNRRLAFNTFNICEQKDPTRFS